MSRYSVRRIQEPRGFRMVKWDDDLNVEKIYTLRIWQHKIRCVDCPHRGQSVCRHRIILERFHLSTRIDSGWFYDYERDRWHKPLTKYVRK